MMLCYREELFMLNSMDLARLIEDLKSEADALGDAAAVADDVPPVLLAHCIVVVERARAALARRRIAISSGKGGK
jgi:hypothetical protein